jgi:four helix bundle protein
VTSLRDKLTAWEAAPPEDLEGDPIWRLPAYRIALFLSEVVREDVETIARHAANSHVPAQLERAVDSIGVNITEGYSRFSGRDRARYYEMALGSAREAREWYRRCSRWLGGTEVRERTLLLTQAVRILTSAVPRERAGESEARLMRASAARKRQSSRPGPE